jgi:hypothetical protein
MDFGFVGIAPVFIVERGLPQGESLERFFTADVELWQVEFDCHVRMELEILLKGPGASGFGFLAYNTGIVLGNR